MKYIAINIGPIIATFSLARKPRELWSASYMFSHLMKRIIESVSTKAELISPYYEKRESKMDVGLFPDRAFFKVTEEADIIDLINKALTQFSKDSKLKPETVKDYFNIMVIAKEANNDGEAISIFNKHLNFLELNNSILESNSEVEIVKLLKIKGKSPLYDLAFNTGKFNIETLAEIATKELLSYNEAIWNEISIQSRVDEKIQEEFPKYKDLNEGGFLERIKSTFKTQYKSYHKYVCIVQADGDSMGKVVTQLADGEVNNLSKELVTFGKNACDCVTQFGGLPIYAGGDDLLFIAPVVGKNHETIFELLQEIDDKYDPIKKQVVNYELTADGAPVQTSMSYGVSITYYKYPLYEAWASARELLFDKAKKVTNKDAIAWKFQKHSGSSFSGIFSKKQSELYCAFENVIQTTTNESTVSAVAHKIRESSGLLKLLIGKEKIEIKERLKAFFEKVMEYESKPPREKEYLDAVKYLLFQLFIQLDTKKSVDENINVLTGTTYGMLRTAKFIKGEEDRL